MTVSSPKSGISFAIKYEVIYIKRVCAVAPPKGAPVT